MEPLSNPIRAKTYLGRSAFRITSISESGNAQPAPCSQCVPSSMETSLTGALWTPPTHLRRVRTTAPGRGIPSKHGISSGAWELLFNACLLNGDPPTVIGRLPSWIGFVGPNTACCRWSFLSRPADCRNRKRRTGPVNVSVLWSADLHMM